MRTRFISWGLALGLGLPGGLASISSARADAPEAAGSAAQQAAEAAEQAGQAAEQAGEAAKSAGKAADEAGEAAGTAAGSAADEASETAKKASDTASSTSAKGKDARLEAAVERRLERGDMEDGVGVQAKNGVVTLTGTVESEALRERIVNATTKTDGVKDVNDDLKVEKVHQEGEAPEMR
jgi:osmotically-inducible protein OsmY